MTPSARSSSPLSVREGAGRFVSASARRQPDPHPAFRSRSLERRISLAMAKHTFGPKDDHTPADRIRCTRDELGAEVSGLTDDEFWAVCLRSRRRSAGLEVPGREEAIDLVKAGRA